MKKWIIAAGFLILQNACSLDKESLNGPASGSFPASVEEANSGLNAIYASLTAFSASTCTWWKILDDITDIGATRVNAAKYVELINSGASAENAVANKLYNCCYKTIARCNILLDALDNLSGTVSEEEIESIRTEASCVRAFCYNELCKHFGDVPYVDHTLSLTDNQYPREAKETIIDNVLADLSDERLAWLTPRHDPDSYGTARIGRVAALGLRARIQLDWGRYADAARSAADCLELARNAGYTLQTMDLSFCGESHEAGEVTGQTALFGYAGESSNEWLWAVQYNGIIDGNTTEEAYYMMPRTQGGCSYFGPTQAFIDMFQCKDGKSIVDSPLYDWKNPWSNRDPRLDLYCLRPGSRIYNIEFQTSTTAKKVMNYSTGNPITNMESQGTKGVYGPNGSKGPAGYLWRKFLDIAELERGAIANKATTDLNCGLMRLSEIYLIEAEANIEMTGGNLELARKDLNLIRERVDMPALAETSQSGLRSAVRYERTVELCSEGFRWYDIRRWGMAATVMNGKIYAPNQDGSMSNAKPAIDENWHVSYDENRTWDGTACNLRVYNTAVFKTGKDELWPLPQSELDTNKLITENNPGY